MNRADWRWSSVQLFFRKTKRVPESRAIVPGSFAAAPERVQKGSQ